MRTPLLISLLLAAGCRASAPTSVGSLDGWQAELAGRVAGPEQTCISDLSNQSPRVIDSRTVAYDVGSTIWVNRLSANCPALSRYNSLILEVSASHICRGDRVRGARAGGKHPRPVLQP